MKWIAVFAFALAANGPYAGRYVAPDFSPASPGQSPPQPARYRGTLDAAPLVDENSGNSHIDGHVVIDGRRVAVSLPVSPRGDVGIRRGPITVDGQSMFAWDDEVLFKVGGRVLSVESADYPARTFVLKEHPASDYRYIFLTVGSTLPDFAFTDFDGKARKLSDFRGKYVLLDFWGTWCGPCLAEFPALGDAYARLRARGFEIIGLDSERGGTIENVRRVIAEKHVTWPVAMPDTVKDLIEKRLRIMAFPTLVLLDRNGVIVDAESLHTERIIQALDRLVSRALRTRSLRVELRRLLQVMPGGVLIGLREREHLFFAEWLREERDVCRQA